MGLRQGCVTLMLAAGVAVILAAGAACGGSERAAPTALPVATPAPQEKTGLAPGNGPAGDAGIAATYLADALLSPLLSRGGAGGPPRQTLEPAEPGQAERLRALLPEQAPGLEQVFEGSFRAKGPQGEALVAVRVFAEGTDDPEVVVSTVAVQFPGAAAGSLREWRGLGLGQEELARVTQVMAQMLNSLGIQAREVSLLDTAGIGDASLGLRLRLQADSEEMTLHVAAARRDDIVLIAGAVTTPGAQASDVVTLLREMDRRARNS